MIDAAQNEWWRTLLRLAFTSGLRQGELLNLRWEDVDLDRGTVTVSPKRAGTFEAGGREYPVLEWTAKDHETRVIPVPPETVSALRRFREWFQGTTRSAYVFLSLDTLDRLTRHMEAHDGGLPDKLVGSICDGFKRIKTRAEGADGAGPWSAWCFKHLRSGFATIAAQHLRTHELQRLMGHSKVETTMRYYVGDVDTGDRLRAAFAAAS